MIANNVKKLRQSACLTGSELAALAQITRGYVNRIENGGLPSLAVRVRIAKALEQPVHVVFPPNPDPVKKDSLSERRMQVHRELLAAQQAAYRASRRLKQARETADEQTKRLIDECLNELQPRFQGDIIKFFDSVDKENLRID